MVHSAGALVRWEIAPVHFGFVGVQWRIAVVRWEIAVVQFGGAYVHWDFVVVLPGFVVVQPSSAPLHCKSSPYPVGEETPVTSSSGGAALVGAEQLGGQRDRAGCFQRGRDRFA